MPTDAAVDPPVRAIGRARVPGPRPATDPAIAANAPLVPEPPNQGEARVPAEVPVREAPEREAPEREALERETPVRDETPVRATVYSRWLRQPAYVAVAAVPVTVVVAAAVLFGATDAGSRATWTVPEASPLVTVAESPPAQPAFPPPAVEVEFSGFYSWAALDRRTGAWYGSPNQDQTNFSESMIKAWIAADFLNQAELRGTPPDERRLDQLSRSIRDSDNGSAESLWRASGGDASTLRLIQTCGLVDTTIYPGWWSQTRMSARDAVAMGECIANGTAAGPKWTAWVLDEMRQVRGSGRFGIIDAFPPEVAATIAIKNGWFHHQDDTWNVNCLAIHDDWILAVMADYHAGRGLEYGARLCAMIAEQVLRPTS